ncbi:two-component sensor histidine kinase [Alicyclobacillus cycloheptanicus]|uniref:histidine kinase n=1 Tax=Alicyclobacillus cycloheptanicus TaxID=1457 RepID=A0ABT9XFS9_9BACL|nr:ATP-binding protein [Alicyclobacillus cycloheptanicus]MDQ0189156.1 signal transduction histidine kinase [Alicyclobacillus cycloheptanicus]WDM00348.1 two-component sensor histidine kinase [Alicyclobacillus cycloheptanicus]
MFEKVRVRLTVLTVALFVLLYLLTSATIYGVVRYIVFNNVDVLMQSTADRIIQQILLQEIPTRIPSDTYWYVPNAIPQTNATVDVLAELEKLQQKWSATKRWQITWKSPADGKVYRVINQPTPSGGPGPDIMIAQDISGEIRVLTPLRGIILLVGIVGAAIAGGAGFLWAGRALRPIRTAWDRQVQFVADASHELRTPLAVIQSNLDLVLDHTEQTVEENLEWIDNAHSEARRLTRLVEDLLTLARSDANTTPLRIQTVSVTDLVQHVADLFEPIADAKGLALEVINPPDITLQGDPDRLAQLLIILVDNACKYTDTGGHVTLEVTPQRGSILLRVADTGTGIDPADVPHVFDRFYRADKARARGDTEGTGLGLAIAKWITEAHRGKIQLSSTPGVGTTVTVQLPV